MSIESRSRQYGKVFDHWQIKEFLGSGSGGKTAVFRLVRSDSNRGISALKVVNLIEVRGDLRYFSEFQRTEYETARDACSRSAEQEVWLMDDLRGNTNIVDYLDHTFVDWSDETGFGRDLLIRMELLKDLRSELHRGRVFSETEVLKIGSDICVALIRCHKKNILHRDVKPENIFRNKDGDYKLGDFGVSRVLDACPGAVASTGIGTYEYWPAEQMTGRYDTRVDIYSLGLVLYELCNQNRLPFAASTYATGREVSMRLMGTPLPEPVGASPAVAEVILKACAFEPEDRYQSAEELLRAMNRAASSLQNAPEENTAAKAAAGAHKRTGYTTLPAEAAEEKKPADLYGTMPASADAQSVHKTIPEEPAKKKGYTVKAAEKYEPKYVTRTKDSKKERENPVIWIAGAFVGLCIVALCVGLLFMNGLKKQKPDGSDLILQTETISEAAAQSTIPLAASETAPKETYAPTEIQSVPAAAEEYETTAPTTEPAEPEIQIPDGVTLVEDSWEDGSVTVVAVNEEELWIQVTDNRLDGQVENLGTMWQLEFDFGEETVQKLAYNPDPDVQTIRSYPYLIMLDSLAYREMEIRTTDQDFESPRYNLDFIQNIFDGEYFEPEESRGDSAEHLNINRNGNTYTTTVTMPEWFDVSLYDDLTVVHVMLLPSDFFEQEGHRIIGHEYIHSFTPYE